MSNSIKLPYRFQWSTSHPHIAWVDLHNNGTVVELAVIAIDQRTGDLYFIPIASLDAIDRVRLTYIVGKRDAHKYPLWDLMSNTTLKNGINALEYFQQLVKVRSVSGQIFAPNSGRMGIAAQHMSARPTVDAARRTAGATSLVSTPSEGDIGLPQEAPQEARRGPGRPPAAK